MFAFHTESLGVCKIYISEIDTCVLLPYSYLYFQNVINYTKCGRNKKCECAANVWYLHKVRIHKTQLIVLYIHIKGLEVLKIKYLGI